MSTASPLQIQPRATSQEIAASASAALAKATIEAKFVIAMQRPRSVLNARAAILDACKRPLFAQSAWYEIPNRGSGFTIRFAEQALNAWRNVDVAAVTAWEDEERRLVRITVTDLESNLSFADEVLLDKTVERKFLKDGQSPISVRENTEGKKVYLVACTEDELLLKVNSAKSKVIRNSGLRLIPQDILEEAEAAIASTIEKGGSDSQGSIKRVCDGFAGLGVSPTELELYLGHSLASINPKELSALRSIFAKIRDEEATWSDFRPKANHADDPHQPNAIEADTVTMHIPRPTEQAPSQEAPPTPQSQLDLAVTGQGFTFDDFRAWASASGQIADPDSIGSFDDMSPTVAKRILRIKPEMLRSMVAAKNGGAK